MVGSGDEGGGILRAGLQVVKRRVAAQVFEHLLRVLAGAVVGCPIPADGELMIAQHVHHANLWDGYAEEVGALRHAGTYQQSAVRTAHDGYLVVGGVFLADEPLGSPDEVVEDVLLLHLRTCQMPLLTILATAAQRHLCVDATLLEEGNAHG